MFIDMKARCFMEAAKCLNFTRAAEKLYISQPALSKNIAGLEEECGMKLFYRDPKRNRVALTPAGAVMLCEFQKMEKILDGAVEKAQRAEAGEEGHLTIAMLFGQIFNELGRQVLNNISENYPKIEVEKLSGGFRDLRNWLEEGKTDMIVTYEEEAQLLQNALYEEVADVQLGILIPVDHPLARKRSIKIKDLERYKVIIPDDKETFAVYDRFQELCRLEGFFPEVIPAADLNHMNMMAEMGRGICLTREDSMVTRSPNVKFYPSKELGRVKLVAAWQKDNLNPIITFYHNMYEDVYRKQKKK